MARKRCKIDCQKCNGTGVVRFGKCYSCHGKGWMTENNGIAAFRAMKRKEQKVWPLPRQYKDDSYD